MPRSRTQLFQTLERRIVLSTSLPVMGYLVDYKISDPSNTVFSEDYSSATTTIAHDSLDWAHLNQVNYFALLPKASPAFTSPTPATLNAVSSDGTLEPLTDSGYDPARQLPALVQEAHAKNSNAKVFVTVGAGDPNAIYHMDGLVNTPSAWPTFATAIHNFVTQYGLDGVDLDWEPTAQAGFTVTAAQITNFGKLVQTIKTAYPTMTLTSDTLGDALEITAPNGADTHTTAYMLDSVAIQNIDKINVEAYPVASKAEADAIMGRWATYLTTGNDLNAKPVNAPVRRLLYGIDIASDYTSNSPAGVIEGKVDVTVASGYGGIFLFELNADTASGPASVISRIGAEIAVKTAGNVDVINGTNGIDQITLTRDADNTHIDWTLGSASGRLLAVDPNGLTINGDGANDAITLSAAHGVAVPTLLTLNGTFTVTGLPSLANTTLDLGRSTVYVKYAPGNDSLAVIRQYLSNGTNGNAWSGVSAAGAINSAAAAADRTTAIGYADSADGLNVNPIADSVELKFTYKGDANLDGNVDFADLLVLAQHYGTSSTGWDQGDFDATSKVDFADLLTLAQNYSKHLPAPPLSRVQADPIHSARKKEPLESLMQGA